MPPTHTLHADGHQLRTGFRAVGASGAQVLYDDADAFWNAGWSVIDEREGRTLLARALDVV